MRLLQCFVCKSIRIVTKSSTPVFPNPNRYYVECQDCKARTIEYTSARAAEEAFLFGNIRIDPGKCPRCNSDATQVQTIGGKLNEQLVVHCLNCGYKLGIGRKGISDIQLVAEWNIKHERQKP